MPFGEVSHLGWVVKDLHATIDYWEKIGIGKIYVDEEHRLENTFFRGKPADVLVRWGWAQLGRVGLEMFEPVRGYSAYDRFMEKHGEGIQHVAFAQETVEQLESRLAALAGVGVEVLERGTFRNGQGIFVYLDTEPAIGVDVELAYDPNYAKRKNDPPPAPPDGQLDPFGQIIQYAFCVPDVDGFCGYLQKLGFAIREINRDNQGLERRYRGRKDDIRMHMGWSKFGEVTAEIIQPTKGRSIYDEFIEKHGGGFHHIAFAVSDMDRTLASLKERGVEISQDGAWGKTSVEGRFAYLDTDSHGGLTIELLWDAP
ncbi:MAG TPA: VOC family protein [Candidatus Glassbacteria bacterium]|nr:VOC family protein [Candidatus Glassbacteria bacterium]